MFLFFTSMGTVLTLVECDIIIYNEMLRVMTNKFIQRDVLKIIYR